MATVAITDATFAALDIEEEILAAAGARVVRGTDATRAGLAALVATADAVITQFARVDAGVIGAMERARAIVRYGIGVDNVDLDAARARGIPVCNVPDYCIDEVADHTLAFILAATRQVVPNTLLVRDGRWGLATDLGGMKTLRDQTVGLLGFGRIGREVAARLAPFKCRRLVCDAFVSPDSIRATGCEPVAFDELLAAATILSLHCPSTPATRRIIDAAAFERLPTGAILVNLARGDLVDTAALVAALESGRLAAAALDVCDPEPIPADSALRRLPTVTVAAHVASASPKAVRTLRETAARIAAAALRGELPPNVVNGVTQAVG